jgi:hypothetical protein
MMTEPNCTRSHGKPTGLNAGLANIDGVMGRVFSRQSNGLGSKESSGNGLPGTYEEIAAAHVGPPEKRFRTFYDEGGERVEAASQNKVG